MLGLELFAFLFPFEIERVVDRGNAPCAAFRAGVLCALGGPIGMPQSTAGSLQPRLPSTT